MKAVLKRMQRVMNRSRKGSNTMKERNSANLHRSVQGRAVQAGQGRSGQAEQGS